MEEEFQCKSRSFITRQILPTTVGSAIFQNEKSSTVVAELRHPSRSPWRHSAVCLLYLREGSFWSAMVAQWPVLRSR